MRRFFSFSILLLFGIYGIILVSHNNLGLYIHPRFFNISVAASIFAVVVGSIGIIEYLSQAKPVIKKTSNHTLLIPGLVIISFFTSPLFIIFAIILLFAPLKNKNINKGIRKFSIPSLIVLLIISIGIALPPKGLSSIAASQRSIDLNSINLTETTLNTVSSFTNNTKNYNLGDWIASITYNPDLDFYKGKEVNLIGFIYKPTSLNLDEDNFLISRFIITCCAVDARPVGLKVKYDWQKNYKQDQWIKLEGVFDIYKQELIIIPSKIEKTEAPSNPYIY